MSDFTRPFRASIVARARFVEDLVEEKAARGVAQYVSNCARADGAAMIRELLARWDANRADIPAHYNPDLRP